MSPDLEFSRPGSLVWICANLGQQRSTHDAVGNWRHQSVLNDSAESRSDLLDFAASTPSTGTVPSSPLLVHPIPSAASPFSPASTTASSNFQFPPNRRSTFESRHLTPGVAIMTGGQNRFYQRLIPAVD
ncbi:hypothetical protein V490_00191 [Pseudogymnoascus sp. VKM F-3557]|nr:hypothetical protein V490_00191 [Pseudogymnoascus sp. VKM F-3557]